MFTLLKASVYSMVLQQQLDVENREAEEGGDEDEDVDMGGYS